MSKKILSRGANVDNTVLVSDVQPDGAQAMAISGAGLAPSNTLEAAIFATLSPGAYTALLTGESGGIGVGLVEIYQIGMAH